MAINLGKIVRLYTQNPAI